MTYLFFDTETSGRFNFKQPFNHPSQPRCVQLGALLATSPTQTIAEANFIIYPNNFNIPKEAAAVHGIDTEHANQYGFDSKHTMTTLYHMMLKADIIIAHNIKFDNAIINNEFYIHGLPMPDKRLYCTMLAATAVCKLPGRGGSYKWPTLQEAHLHFFGESFDGAHDAMADVKACARVYWELTGQSK